MSKLDSAPEHVKKFLIRECTDWQNCSNKESIKNETDAYNYIFSGTEYAFRMGVNR